MAAPRIQSLLVVNGVEVINGYRMWSYAKNNPGVQLEAAPVGCVCSALFRDMGSPTLTDPAGSAGGQQAPWYSASVAASADLFGYTIENIDGLDTSPVERGIAERAGDGANVGLERLHSRTLTFAVGIVARTYPGMAYGIRWIADRLAQCDPCATSTIIVRTACPPSDGSNDTQGKWTLYRVAQTGTFEETTPEYPDDSPFIATATFELTAADPWLYGDPSACIAQTTLVPQDYTDSFAVDSIASGLWVQEAGTWQVTGGQLKANAITTNMRIRRAAPVLPVAQMGRLYRNATQRLKHHTGTSVASYRVALAGHWRNAGAADASYLMAFIDGGNLALTDVRTNGSITSGLATIATTAIAINTDYWLDLTITGRLVEAAHWTTDPALGGTPAQTLSVVLTDEQFAQQGQPGLMGIAFYSPIQAAAFIDDWAVTETAEPALEWLNTNDSNDPPELACVISAPPIGVTGGVVTFVASASRSMVGVAIHEDPAAYPAAAEWPGMAFPLSGAGAPLLPSDGRAPQGIVVSELEAGATLVVDCARQFATLTRVDGTVVDGAFLLDAPEMATFAWPQVERCTDGRIIVEPQGWCSDDGTTLVTIQQRTKVR